MALNLNALAALSLITQIGGGLTSAVGSYYSGRSYASSANYQATIAQLNTQLSELAAQNELLRGQEQIGALTMRTGELKAKQRTALAANGVDLGVGSAAEQLASTDLMKTLDMQTLKANAMREAWGHRLQGVNQEAQATAYRLGAKGVSPSLNALSSLLGSAGSVASSWYLFSKAGG